jgi:hypothetical protein
MDLNAVTDVACWLARITERARYFHFDILNSNIPFRRLSTEIVANARRESCEQQLAAVDSGALSNDLRSYCY